MKLQHFKLQNKSIGDTTTQTDGTTAYGKRLAANPLQLTHNTTAIKVFHQDHGMYSTSPIM